MDEPSGYGESDVERLIAEKVKPGRRGPFARDRARVVHSAALRRLGFKTQVVGPATDDFVRNRLTHSLEVAQVGREMAVALGCDPDVVDTACLAHDLGHPPFGHNGEAVLNELAVRIGGFEGNAQTLRVLTRLEPKIQDPGSGRWAGLNLTRASLDAATKYPWTRPPAPGRPAGGTGKFGAYREDQAAFDWLRQGAPAGRRCMEAQVMDLADDVAYSVHDLEDAVVAGYLGLGVLWDTESVQMITSRIRDWYLPEVDDEEVRQAVERLRGLPAWIQEPGTGYGFLAALKNLTSLLIGRFTGAAQDATRLRYGPGALTRYSAEIVVPRPTLMEITVLKGMAAVWVMMATDRQPLYAVQRRCLAELVPALADRGPQALEQVYAEEWTRACDDAGRLRAVLDQVAALTDTSAVAWHRRLLPGENCDVLI
ncbi:MAG: dGTPase [Actinomycetota bacterium]|nr:dGTPase [Actinomycetota bacterium]